MHPAYSVLIFTTLSGAGYGLLFLLGVLGAAGAVPADPLLGTVSLGLALAMITGGLLSSALHLGHPERAWRAVGQWRSSWLSREGVVALATYVPALAFALGWIAYGRTNGAWSAFGVAAALGAFATVYCTGMIYASLKTIRQWHNDWVTPGYLLLAFATGAVWLFALSALFGQGRALFAWLALVALLLGALAKLGYWRSIDGARRGLTLASATGLDGMGTVRPWENAHSEPNYLMREMGFGVARKHAFKLRRLALFLGFGVPAILIVLAGALGSALGTGLVGILAALIAMAGVLIERWLFFAEAQHVVSLYYGAERA